jgi:hypothetical protein
MSGLTRGNPARRGLDQVIDGLTSERLAVRLGTQQ